MAFRQGVKFRDSSFALVTYSQAKLAQHGKFHEVSIWNLEHAIAAYKTLQVQVYVLRHLSQGTCSIAAHEIGVKASYTSKTLDTNRGVRKQSIATHSIVDAKTACDMGRLISAGGSAATGSWTFKDFAGQSAGISFSGWMQFWQSRNHLLSIIATTRCPATICSAWKGHCFSNWPAHCQWRRWRSLPWK